MTTQLPLWGEPPPPPRRAFVPPTGHGRCSMCGWHVRTQSHAPTCARRSQVVARKPEGETLGNAMDLAESTVRRRYGKVFIDTPNGNRVYGWKPGLSGVTLVEHVLRDRLAVQVDGVTEAVLRYGRPDVLTAAIAFEVERCTKWRIAVRQALQYAAQTGCRPAVALFGVIPRDDLLKLYRRLRDDRPPVELWWWRRDIERWRWYRISSVDGGREAASWLKRFGSGEHLVQPQGRPVRRRPRRRTHHDPTTRVLRAADRGRGRREFIGAGP